MPYFSSSQKCQHYLSLLLLFAMYFYIYEDIYEDIYDLVAAKVL